MGISGVMQLTNPSTAPTSTTQENVGGGLETSDTYTFDVDFNAVGETFVFHTVTATQRAASGGNSTFSSNDLTR